MQSSTSRGSRSQTFLKIGVLEDFANLSRQHLCQSLFFSNVDNVADLASNITEKETPAQVFSCEFGEIFKNTFFTEHFWVTASVVMDRQK